MTIVEPENQFHYSRDLPQGFRDEHIHKLVQAIAYEIDGTLIKKSENKDNRISYNLGKWNCQVDISITGIGGNRRLKAITKFYEISGQTEFQKYWWLVILAALATIFLHQAFLGLLCVAVILIVAVPVFLRNHTADKRLKVAVANACKDAKIL